jgi:homoserine O-acetyltransferase
VVAAEPAVTEGDFVLRNFRFASGETLPELRLHYRTLGKVQRDAKGVASNAVLIMHGTGRYRRAVPAAEFPASCSAPAASSTPNASFVILPDGIGHGQSSKPSDGLHARFPHYGYDDMIAAQYRLITEGLGVQHLRLVMGTSMGGMHSGCGAQRYPDSMDALMPLASLPSQISGRNRVWRRIAIDAIRLDPQWRGGDYSEQPPDCARAEQMLFLMGSNPVLRQQQMPDLAQSDSVFDAAVADSLRGADANDVLYQLEASHDYDPAPGLEKIRAPLLAINFADDLINPPELGILEREIKRVPHGRALRDASDAAIARSRHAHVAAVWKEHLAELLRSSRLTTEPADRSSDSPQNLLAHGGVARVAVRPCRAA